jgi:hypothetical protein
MAANHEFSIAQSIFMQINLNFQSIQGPETLSRFGKFMLGDHFDFVRHFVFFMN